MKILSAADRLDTNRGMRDLDDVRMLLRNKVVCMTYEDDAG